MKPIEIIQRYKTLRASKQELIDTMIKVNQFFQPSDKTYSGQNSIDYANKTEKGELLDTTVSDTFKEYVANVLGLYFNVEVNWFKIEIPSVKITEPDSLILERRAKLLYRLISKTNYYSVCPQHEWDALIQGHACMSIEKDSKQFARCYTIDPTNLVFVQNYRHEISELYWETLYNVFDFKERFPKYKLEASTISTNTNSVVVLNVVVPNKFPYNEGLEKKSKKKFIFRQFFHGSGAGVGGMQGEELKDPMFIDDGRFIPCRNIPSRSHPYGDGEGKKGLPRSRILNKLTRDSLIASGNSARTPIAVSSSIKRQVTDNDGEIKTGVIFVPPASPTNPALSNQIMPLNTRTDIQGILTLIQHQEAKIAQQLPTTSQTYKVSRQSIQEIQQRLRDSEKRIGPLRSHYLKEAVSQHLKRFYKIAKEQGYFKDDEYQFEDPTLDKKIYEFTFDALMLQSYRLTQALQLNQSLAQAQQILAIKPTASVRLNENSMMKAIFNGNGQAVHLHTDEETAQALREIQAERQRQTQIEEQAIHSKGLKDASKGLSSVLGVLPPEGQP